MGKIHLIRHGITEGNKARVYYGSTDLPLISEGVVEIADLAAAGTYPEADGAGLYTTGLLRTEQTFFLIYGSREHREIPELREYDFGEFEMKSHKQLVESEDYQAWISDREGMMPCPNGESLNDFKDRINTGFSEILEKYKSKESRNTKSIVICHGGVISQIMNICFPDGKENIFQWIPEPGRGYTIHIDGIEPIAFDEI